MRKPAYYQYRVLKSADGTLSLVPLFRYLNDGPMNYVFEAPHDCKIHMLGPVESINGYIGYALKYTDFESVSGVVMLHTSTDLLPWGVGRSDQSDGAYLFRMDAENVFEVFIFPGKADQAYQQLMMLKDGLGGIRDQIDAVIEDVATIKASGAEAVDSF
jgi:hypothetical protein